MVVQDRIFTYVSPKGTCVHSGTIRWVNYSRIIALLHHNRLTPVFAACWFSAECGRKPISSGLPCVSEVWDHVVASDQSGDDDSITSQAVNYAQEQHVAVYEEVKLSVVTVCFVNVNHEQ